MKQIQKTEEENMTLQILRKSAKTLNQLFEDWKDLEFERVLCEKGHHEKSCEFVKANKDKFELDFWVRLKDAETLFEQEQLRFSEFTEMLYEKLEKLEKGLKELHQI